MTDLILWISLSILSGPVLVDWGRHIASHSWAAYVVIFPILTVLCARNQSRQRTYVIPALFAAGLGIAIQLWALASVTVRNGRPGFILCAIAILLLRGHAHWRVVVPLLLCIPIPHGVLVKLGQASLPLATELVAAMAQHAGTPAFATARSVEFPGGIIYLDASDLGLSAAILGGGLAWFACSRVRLKFADTVLLSSLAALFGSLTNILLTCVALILTEPAGAFANRSLRDFVAYGLVAAAIAIISGTQLPARLLRRLGLRNANA